MKNKQKKIDEKTANFTLSKNSWSFLGRDYRFNKGVATDSKLISNFYIILISTNSFYI